LANTPRHISDDSNIQFIINWTNNKRAVSNATRKLTRVQDYLGINKKTGPYMQTCMDQHHD